MESRTQHTMLASSPPFSLSISSRRRKREKMLSISAFRCSIPPNPSLFNSRIFPPTIPSICRRFPPFSHFLASPSISRRVRFRCKSAEEEGDVAQAEDEWLQKLPEKKKALYSHSLPCIEAWLRSLGFRQSREDRAVWFVEKADWHAQLSLDVTDLYIRYLKSGAGNLEKEVERRFSYALSREDIENAILGGP